MRKRIANVAALLGALALAGALLDGAAALFDGARTAHAQESGGEQQAGAEGNGAETELTEWQKARIARYQAARAASAGVSGQASAGLISGLDTIDKGGSDSFTVGAGGLDADFNYRYDFFLRASGNGGIGFNSACTLLTTVVNVPRGNTTYSAPLTLHGCEIGTYTLTAILREESTGEREETTLETDVETVRVRQPIPTVEPDATPTFGTATISNKSWTRNSRISSFTLPQATGGDGTLSYSLSPALPTGVTRSGHSVSGTPTVTKSRTQYTWAATDSDPTNPDSVSLTFYVTVVLEPPTITISRSQSSVEEGRSATFTLRANHAPLSSITVNISVTERGSFIRGSKPTSVRIPAGFTSRSFSVQTDDDDTDEPHGSITAQVRRGTGYSVGTTSSASVTVRDEDPPPTVTPPDLKPRFSTTISDKSWTRNSRISSFTLPQATGGDGTLTYSLSPALPNGVTRSGRSVSGTPTGTLARTKYTWKATDGDRSNPDSVSLSFYITVTPPDLKPSFSTTISNKSWKRNKAISSFRLPAATGGDGTLTYSLNRALPNGVTRSNFTVRGTPSALKASTQYTWTATDRDGDTASLSFYITVVANKTPTFGTATISDKSWTHNKIISSFRLPAATDGDGNLRYSLNRALPSGVTRSNFTVYGTPNALKANTKYTWTATDRDGDTASLSFYIAVVANKTPTFGTVTINNKSWTHNKAISSFALPAATGGDGRIRYSLNPALPSGVTRSNFTVRGTPNALKASTEYTWTATDADGDKASRTFNIKVLPQVSIAAGPSITEGANATFTLTASAAPPSNLAVSVSVSQSSFISGTPPKSVTIPANGTSVTLTVPTKDDSTDEPNGSITASVVANAAYELGSAFRASVAVQDNDLPKLAAPTGLTVTPLMPEDHRTPEWKARLDWGVVANRSRYQVEVRKTGGSWAAASSGSVMDASYKIDLRSIIGAGADSEGLAQASAYQFRVKAIASGSTRADSDYSAVVEIRDTPITSINGDSRSRTDGKGQAVVTWGAVPGATAFTLRWRKLPYYTGKRVLDGREENVTDEPPSGRWWLPTEAKTENDWSTSAPIGQSSSSLTVSGLDLNEIYAFQLTYTHADGQGFAARESYVWPSTRGANKEFVASLPLKDPLPKPTSKDNVAPRAQAIYKYVICDDTFPQDRLTDWKNLIQHAAQQWQQATNGLVAVSMEDSMDGCAFYSEVVAKVQSKIETMPGYASDHIQSVLNEINLLDITEKDRVHNEIIKLSDTYLDTANAAARIFPETAMYLSSYKCARNASACAPHPDELPNEWLTTDILISSGANPAREELAIPGGDIKFNACSKFWYAAIVHEVGHVLGIRDHATGALLSIMNYSVVSQTVTYDNVVRRTYACSPHPLDVMIAYALYQVGGSAS